MKIVEKFKVKFGNWAVRGRAVHTKFQPPIYLI
jgi:hypothetical protein